MRFCQVREDDGERLKWKESADKRFGIPCKHSNGCRMLAIQVLCGNDHSSSVSDVREPTEDAIQNKCLAQCKHQRMPSKTGTNVLVIASMPSTAAAAMVLIKAGESRWPGRSER